MIISRQSELAGLTILDCIHSFHHLQKENIMSKGQNRRKDSKKEPAKTMKEKKAAKRDKKNQKMSHPIFDQERKTIV
jgi:hypothetical protein